MIEDDDDKKEVEVQLEEAEEEVSETEEDDNEEEAVEASEPDKKPRQSKFKKRIDDLVHKQREAERQRDEYYRVAQKMIEQNNELRQSAKQYSESTAEEMEARIASDLEKAKADYKKAYDEGDADAILDAQDRMLKANSLNSKVDKVKESSSAFEQNQQQLAPPPDSRAVEWANKNKWFNSNRVMTSAAYAIHDEVISQGIKPDTNPDTYYETVDKRMREEFPQYFSEEPSDSSSRKTVTNVVTPGGNQSGRSKKVRLSPSQVAVANRLGVPLEEYAKQFVALEN